MILAYGSVPRLTQDLHQTLMRSLCTEGGIRLAFFVEPSHLARTAQVHFWQPDFGTWGLLGGWRCLKRHVVKRCTPPAVHVTSKVCNEGLTTSEA